MKIWIESKTRIYRFSIHHNLESLVVDLYSCTRKDLVQWSFRKTFAITKKSTFIKSVVLMWLGITTRHPTFQDDTLRVMVNLVDALIDDFEI